jgi:hypothetical protein
VKARIIILCLVVIGIVLLLMGLYGVVPPTAQETTVTVLQASATLVPTNTAAISQSTPEPVSPTAEPTALPTTPPTAAPTATPVKAPPPTPRHTVQPDPLRPLEDTEMERDGVPGVIEVDNPEETPAENPADNPPETPADSPAEDPVIAPPSAPIDSRSVFYGRVWVGLYGAPSGPGLGILGTQSATNTVAMAVQQALAYQDILTDAVVIPFFHMVTTVADPHAGADGDYNHRMTTETIQLWIDVAHTHGLVSVLDIQTGYSPVLTELEYLEPFLRQKDVHLAIDPEFMMTGTDAIPGQRIGHMPAQTLNIAQAWLSNLAEAVGEQKALIIHQFDNRMFSGKEFIEDYVWVDLVWDSDGFGGPGAKIGDYVQYAAEPGFEFGGFKLFYNYDTPVMTPAQVLGLNPRPVFVVYQ